MAAENMSLEFLVHVILVGILATYFLLAMALWAHRIGLARLDFAKVMAGLSYGESFDGDPPYFAGQIVIYFNGIFFALLYAAAVGQYLPEPPLLAGAIWGVILFLASGLFYVPLYLREGFFLSHVHKRAWMTSLMVHGGYGVILGWLCPVL
ncbi:MAG: hypothetical protein O7C63_07765 [Alphaproteobacteria bacterium]|nr:hypothetical protein [Alphaproteobacteria bacterium]MCZ6764814.1 hypothetical protein [Alphaproteobacteria bacterium]